MDEKTAWEIVARPQTVTPANYQQAKKHMWIAHEMALGIEHLRVYAKGYLAGLEAERERVKPFVKAVNEFIDIMGDGPDDSDVTMAFRILFKAKAAYTTPHDAGERP